jgi:hypothetical protein
MRTSSIVPHISPIRRASAAVTKRPVSSMYMALCLPMTRGSQ